MKIREFLNLGGKKKVKTVMSSRVMLKTGNESLVDLGNVLWDILTSTDYLREDVRAILVGGYTHEEASEAYGTELSYLKQLVSLAGKGIDKDLGIDPLPYLLGEEKFTDKDKDKLESVILIAHALYAELDVLDEDVFDKIGFDLKDKKMVRKSELGDKAFIETVQALDFVSKPKMENKLNTVGDEVLGYLVYLLKTDERYLTRKDLQRKDLLKEVWWV